MERSETEWSGGRLKAALGGSGGTLPPEINMSDQRIRSCFPEINMSDQRIRFHPEIGEMTEGEVIKKICFQRQLKGII